VVLVVEEMEAVLDDLGDLDRSAQKATRIRLRQIARMGRKAGCALVAVTQAARTDVFDSHVRTNLANVFLFRNGQTTAEMFRVKVDLPGLAQGMAYSLQHGAMVQFPRMTTRPDLKMSRLYNERFDKPDLKRVAEEEVIDAEVIDADGAVVAGTVATVGTATTGQMGAFQTVATVPEANGQLPKRMPTPVEAAAMRAHYDRTKSQSAVCRRFYGYKDAAVWDWVSKALRSEI
jgi:hypothetical protein